MHAHIDLSICFCLLQMEHLFMHLWLQAVRHVGSDCRQGFWTVLQSPCKTFISRGYLQCSRAEWWEQRVWLIQREIGDWWRLQGMLLVMRSQGNSCLGLCSSPPALFSIPFVFVQISTILTITVKFCFLILHSSSIVKIRRLFIYFFFLSFSFKTKLQSFNSPVFVSSVCGFTRSFLPSISALFKQLL